MPDVVALSDSFVASLPKGWNATVRIKQANGTTDATVYKDANGDATGANPLPLATADFGRNYDGNGGWQCYLVPGDYVVSVTPHGGSEHHTSVTVTAAAAKVVRAVYEVYGTPAAGQVPTWSDDDGHLEWADPTGGGGGASEPLGDYARWEATGGFDYTTIAAHSGTSVTFDNSADWMNNWGTPAAVVTEAGTYSLSLATKSATQAGNDYLGLALMDPTGADLALYAGFSAAANPTLSPVADVEGDGTGFRGQTSLTAYLPANTHIDTRGTGDTSVLFIQRVA